MMKLTVAVILLVTINGSHAARPTPAYVWPLGNTTLNAEVMTRHDAVIPDDGQCFRFRQGYPGLPYDALKLAGDNESRVDISMTGNVTFKDLSISFMVYPDTAPQGTLVNYLYKTGNILKISMLENYLFISFWDEFGVSVGSTALPDVLLQDTWSHIVVTREFLTGRIRVFHNGEMLEDLDDDFPNEIQLPSEGALRIGQSLDEPMEPFIGRVSCLQLYDVAVTPEEVSKTKENCYPRVWKFRPQVYMRKQFVDGEVRQCISDGPQPKIVNCDIISITCLSGGEAWSRVMTTNNWASSGKDSAYFRRQSRGKIPEARNERILGKVKVTNRVVCIRLCMRVKGCRSYAYGEEGDGSTTCVLMDRKLEATVSKPGWVYYAFVKEVPIIP